MRFTVEGDDGAPIDFECADTMVSRWVCGEILEGKTYPYLPFVTDVGVVFDVGANCGAASVHFARHYPDAAVHAFEPGGEPRAILERNAAAHPNVQVHPIGLHSVDQTVPLYKGDGDSILGSVLPRDINLDDSESVVLRAGGSWAAAEGITRIDVLKVDVEGVEVEVLESLVDLLPTVKVLYVEYDSRQARRDVARIVAATHELYNGVLFLDQGECIYLRKDLAEREEAMVFLRHLHSTGRTAPQTAADEGEIPAGKSYPHLPFVTDVGVVFDVGANHGAASVHFARHYPDAAVHAFHSVDQAGSWAEAHGITRIDVLNVDADGFEVHVLEGLAALLPTVQVLYVEYDSRQALRDLDRMLEASHELYIGLVFLDQGDCIYIRRDLADLPAAGERLRELVAAFAEAT